MSLGQFCSNGSTQFAEQPSPKCFFPTLSPVLDYPRGNLAEVGDLLVEEEVLMVMYYAPWCSHSNKAKKEFEKAATYLENQVQFVGINCWYPLGTCRRQNNFSSYPIFFLYHTTLDGFRYHGESAHNSQSSVYWFKIVATPLFSVMHLLCLSWEMHIQPKVV